MEMRETPGKCHTHLCLALPIDLCELESGIQQQKGRMDV